MATEDRPEDLSFASLRSLVWRYRWRFLFADVLRVIAAVSIAFVPLFFARFVSSTDDKGAAFRYLALILLVNSIHFACWHLGDFFNVYRINPLFYEYKKITFTMFWDKSYSTFIEKPSGKVGSYINQFRTEVYAIYDSYHYGFLPMAAAIPVYGYLIARAAWQNSVVYGVFLLVSGAALVACSRPLNRNQRVVTDSDSSNSGRVFDSYANFVNVFAFRARRKEITRNDAQVDAVIRDDIKAGRSVMTYWTVASLLARMVLWPSTLLYGWYLYDRGTISFADLIVSVAVLFDFTQQFWNVVHQLGVWNQSVARFRESYTYLFPAQNAVRDFFAQHRTLADEPLALRSALEIRNLTFAYPDAPDLPVLRDVSITVAKHEKVGIVGRSGSGKSTLVKVLLGFYDVDDGAILVDDVAVDTRELAQIYAYVPQDTTLFQESIFYNIAYASDGAASLDEVRDAAAKAHIADFVEALPDGYETMVGERGVKLSLGQRQRIAIARAFLKPSDLLILDEATSALDSQTETHVQQSFEALWGDKSVIAIAHRLSTLNNVDRIVVMDAGAIVEEGTKEDLLALDGHFADLWNHQRAGMI